MFSLIGILLTETCVCGLYCCWLIGLHVIWTHCWKFVYLFPPVKSKPWNIAHMQAAWIISTFWSNWLFVVDLPGIYIITVSVYRVCCACRVLLVYCQKAYTYIQDKWLSISVFLYFNSLNNHENVMSQVLKFISHYFEVCTVLHVQFIIQTNNCTTYIFTIFHIL